MALHSAQHTAGPVEGSPAAAGIGVRVNVPVDNLQPGALFIEGFYRDNPLALDLSVVDPLQAAEGGGYPTRRDEVKICITPSASGLATGSQPWLWGLRSGWVPAGIQFLEKLLRVHSSRVVAR